MFVVNIYGVSVTMQLLKRILNFKYFMIIYIIFVCIIKSVYFDISNITAKSLPFECLQFNTLISFPDKAFNQSNQYSSIADSTKITPFEFNQIIENLYLHNYILVNPKDIFTYNESKLTTNFENNNIPKSKKPILLTFDNVTYTQHNGDIDKLIVDRNNNIATYTSKKSIQDRVQYDNEFVVILEDFIRKHPDFSYNNARGIIFLTGENGILGYNTSHKNASYRQEAKRVIEVIHKLKYLGWEFGCNNYFADPNIIFDDLQFAKSLSLWNKEVKPLISTTPFYAYRNIQTSPLQQELLESNNFKFFFSNSNQTSYNIINNVCHITRIPINGHTLRNNRNELLHLFDSELVYDHTNRLVNYFSFSE